MPRPFQMDLLPVPGTPGHLGLMACPGHYRDLEQDLEDLVAWRADVLVTLVEPMELEGLGVPDLPEEAARRMTHLWLPIPDGGVPDAPWEKAWAEAAPRLRHCLMQGGRVVLHCHAGLGRTGTVAARILVSFGVPPREAITRVRQARPGTIETRAQEAYVLALA